jgi:hypothetical protein
LRRIAAPGYLVKGADFVPARNAFLYVLLGAAVLCAGVTQTIRNEKVSVATVVLHPGESETVSGSLPAVNVYFQAGALVVARPGKGTEELTVQRGEALREPGGPCIIRNTGSAELRYVRVAFPGPGSDEKWGTTGLSPRYELIYEDRLARVYNIRIPAHTSEPQHTHHDRVVICLSGAELKHIFPDGREEPSTLATGEVAFRRGTTHVGQNLGNTDLWVVAVEPK